MYISGIKIAVHPRERVEAMQTAVERRDVRRAGPMMCIFRLAGLGLSAFVVAMVALPISASATVFNDAADFSSSNPSGAWSYGQGTTGVSFAPYTVFSTSCNGVSGVSCWQPLIITFGVPVVGLNTTGSTINFGTVVLPTDLLWVHPGPATDSIVRWTAPTGGTYGISGLFELLDTNPTGVIGEIFDNSVNVFIAPLTAPGAIHPNTPGQSKSFALTLSLNANDVISFGVNNAGNFLFDSTGLIATIAPVPEPWSLGLVTSGLFGLWWLRKGRSKKTTHTTSVARPSH
jgi:hypothetical protein